MLTHYLKVTFRNLWKYKGQTFISITGLAVGFACFAMATLWIRYETMFDSSHKNADQLYLLKVKIVRSNFFSNIEEVISHVEIPLDVYLKKTFPEIKNGAKIRHSMIEIEIDDVKSPINMIRADSSFLKIFNIKILAGNEDFLIDKNQKIAITQKKAAQLFGNKNPVGKTVKLFDKEYTIGAIVTGYSNHSNYPFDILLSHDPLIYWGNIIIELNRNIDMESFAKKLYEHKATVEYAIRTFNGNGVFNRVENVENITLVPITSIHYKQLSMYPDAKLYLQRIIIYAISGFLLIICALFNYFSLFVYRFNMRQRELALRVVWGASNISLFMLLAVEFIILLLIALLTGVFLIYILMPSFRALSKINLELSFIYFESLTYIVAVILVALLMFLLMSYILRHRTLSRSIRRTNNKIFRRISIVAQLIISIVFAFCTAIILKQMYYIRNTDLGFTLKDRGVISSYSPDWHFDARVIENLLKQIPEIEKIVIAPSLVRSRSYLMEPFDWDERPKDMEPVHMEHVETSEEYTNFYEFKVIAGEMLNDNDPKNYVMINESAMKIFGWKDPVKKQFSRVGDNETYIIKGVLKDFCRFSFTEPVAPTIFDKGARQYDCILFKYKKDTWKVCKEKISRIIKEKYHDIADAFTVDKEETFYDRRLESENIIFAILTVISTVCIIVCVFGFVSMVSLTCEERRKEIAIRKVNGATVKDILDIFFKEYLTLLAIGALIAFSAGYLIMKQWLEQYMLQTTMSAWVFVLILLVLIIIIVTFVGGKVYKTSRENPIKSIMN